MYYVQKNLYASITQSIVALVLIAANILAGLIVGFTIDEQKNFTVVGRTDLLVQLIRSPARSRW